jgi:hypothetical protein
MIRTTAADLVAAVDRSGVRRYAERQIGLSSLGGTKLSVASPLNVGQAGFAQKTRGDTSP